MSTFQELIDSGIVIDEDLGLRRVCLLHGEHRDRGLKHGPTHSSRNSASFKWHGRTVRASKPSAHSSA